jgi:hypothetical protein
MGGRQRRESTFEGTTWQVKFYVENGKWKRYCVFCVYPSPPRSPARTNVLIHTVYFSTQDRLQPPAALSIFEFIRKTAFLPYAFHEHSMAQSPSQLGLGPSDILQM